MLSWHPGQENLADYQSKHCLGAHHTAVHAWYLHTENSPHFLPRAKAHSALKGFVGTLNDRYPHMVPLPRAPWIQSPEHVTCHMQVTRDNPNTCYSQVPQIPTWSNLTRSLVCLGRTTTLSFAPIWLM
jgi:hypothetical protein